jgi:hypothetical protein
VRVQQYGGKDLLAGWLRSVAVAVAVAVAQREAVSVSVRHNVSPCLLFLGVLLCSALLCLFFFCFAWDLCNLQMYDAGGYPVDAAVPDIGYSALAALPTLPAF